MIALVPIIFIVVIVVIIAKANDDGDTQNTIVNMNEIVGDR